MELLLPNVRIINKIDTEQKWSTSSLALKAGELAIATKSDKSVEIKVGDGTNTYSNIPSKFIPNTEIIKLIKKAVPTLTGDVTSTLQYDDTTGTAKLTTTVVNDSHTHSISTITSLQTKLNEKAPLNSPSLTGTPTAPTADAGTNTDQIASTKYVTTAINNKTSITGNAGSATKLETTRTIGIGGVVTGTATAFDGSKNITIDTTKLNLEDAGVTGELPTSHGGTGRTDGKAVGLVTKRTIDGVSFDGTADITHFGSCSTEAATAAKVVSVPNFVLATGAEVTVRFTVTNTAASPTLNVNSTGAKAIVYRNAAISAGYLAANRVYKFVYDGTNYELIGDIDTNTRYTAASATPQAPGTAAVGTSSKYAREDHIHPLQTTVSGNAGSATKLATARTISLAGAVTGSANFDGSKNISINTTLKSGITKDDAISLIIALS